MPPISSERPTLPAWAFSAIEDLSKQIDRLMTGQGCKTCLAAGTIVHGGKAGQIHIVCPKCNGTGLHQ